MLDRRIASAKGKQQAFAFDAMPCGISRGYDRIDRATCLRAFIGGIDRQSLQGFGYDRVHCLPGPARVEDFADVAAVVKRSKAPAIVDVLDLPNYKLQRVEVL